MLSTRHPKRKAPNSATCSCALLLLALQRREVGTWVMAPRKPKPAPPSGPRGPVDHLGRPLKAPPAKKVPQRPNVVVEIEEEVAADVRPAYQRSWWWLLLSLPFRFVVLIYEFITTSFNAVCIASPLKLFRSHQLLDQLVSALLREDADSSCAPSLTGRVPLADLHVLPAMVFIRAAQCLGHSTTSAASFRPACAAATARCARPDDDGQFVHLWLCGTKSGRVPRDRLLLRDDRRFVLLVPEGHRGVDRGAPSRSTPGSKPGAEAAKPIESVFEQPIQSKWVRAAARRLRGCRANGTARAGHRRDGGEDSGDNIGGRDDKGTSACQ